MNGTKATPHVYIVVGKYDNTTQTIDYNHFALKQMNNHEGDVQQFSKQTIDIPDYDFFLNNIDPYRGTETLTIRYKNAQIFKKTITVGDEPTLVNLDNITVLYVGACMFEHQSTEEATYHHAIAILSNILGVKLEPVEDEQTNATPQYNTAPSSNFYSAPSYGPPYTYDTYESKAVPREKTKISVKKCVIAALCCLPIIIELLAVLLIPHISSLAENAFLSRWGWAALSLPMKISFLSVIALGLAIQILGLFDNRGIVIGIFSQFATFLLFVFSAYAAYDNAASVYTQWGLAVLAPAPLLVVLIRSFSACVLDYDEYFNFLYYLPIALVVVEYALFFLTFPLIFGVTAPLWIFIVLTITTVSAIIVSSVLLENMRWITVGINFAIILLLCFVYFTWSQFI